jgi:hypothetical protein
MVPPRPVSMLARKPVDGRSAAPRVLAYVRHWRPEAPYDLSE